MNLKNTVQELKALVKKEGEIDSEIICKLQIILDSRYYATRECK